MFTIALILAAAGSQEVSPPSKPATYDADPYMDQDARKFIDRFLSEDETTARKAIENRRYRILRGRGRTDRNLKSTAATENLLTILDSKRSTPLRKLAATHVVHFCPPNKDLRKKVLGRVVKIIHSSDEPEEVRAGATLGLCDSSEDTPKTTRALIAGTQRKDPIAVATACRALGKRKTLRPKIVAALSEIARDERTWPVGYSASFVGSEPIAREAIKALAEHGRSAGASLPVLTDLLGDKNSGIAVQSGRAIIFIAKPRSRTQRKAEAALTNFLASSRQKLHDDVYVFHAIECEHALEAIATLPEVQPETETVLRSLLSTDINFGWLTSEIAVTLIRVKLLSAEDIPVLKRWAKRADESGFDESAAKRILAVIDSLATGKPFVDPG